MNTTLLFAELFIVGLQASVWLFILALVLFGFNWLQALTTIGLADWQTVIVVIALSIVYVIGIIVDRIADLAFTVWDKKIRDGIFPTASLPLGVMRFQLGRDNEYLNRQFEYTRSRMRISRASVLNFALITIFSVWLVHQSQFQNPADKTKILITALCSGVLLTLGAAYTWNKLTKTYVGLVKVNWDLYSSQKEIEKNQKATLSKQKRKNANKSKAG